MHHGHSEYFLCTEDIHWGKLFGFENGKPFGKTHVSRLLNSDVKKLLKENGSKTFMNKFVKDMIQID